ncbi:MAG: hypothetical protein R3A44_28340 [Caldilineaceae bacterium]
MNKRNNSNKILKAALVMLTLIVMTVAGGSNVPHRQIGINTFLAGGGGSGGIGNGRPGGYSINPCLNSLDGQLLAGNVGTVGVAHLGGHSADTCLNSLDGQQLAGGGTGGIGIGRPWG